MRDIFPGHFQKTNEQITQIWNNAFFMLDANILLNLYRYSESTKRDFIGILGNTKIKHRLWLPHRAAQEYLQNRSSVIAEQSKSYTDMIGSIKTFKRDLDNKRQHPFVSDKLKLKVDHVLDSLMHELDRSHNQHELRLAQDTIKDEIADLFGPQVTDKYTQERLIEIFIDGDKRYKEKIPPGYKDAHKASDDDSLSNKTRMYGDLILWNQIIEFAKYNDANVILVTDDKKDDWWSIANGKTLGPRPELIEEFEKETQRSILIYQADSFFDYSSKFLKQSVNPDSRDEISHLTERKYRLETKQARLRKTHNEILMLNELINEIQARMSQLEKQRVTSSSELEHLRRFGDEKMIQDTELRLKEIEFELTNLYQQYGDAKARLNMKNSALSGIAKMVDFLDS